MPVIGFLNGGSADTFATYFAAFRNGLNAFGYVDGQNVRIEYRNADGHYDRLPIFAADLVQRKVSAIVTFSLPAVRAAKAATGAIPIVFATGVDPVTSGLIASFSRPGGNLTGISMSESAMAKKQIEMLREIVPKAELIGVLVNPTNPFYKTILPDLQETAATLNIRLSIERVANEQEIDKAFVSLSQSRVSALYVLADPLFNDGMDQLVVLQNRHSLPTVFGPEFARKGGLLGYAANLSDVFHELGTYTGRILKGARPEDLPVEQTTKIQIVINLTTAKALHLTVPQWVLGRADEVIE